MHLLCQCFPCLKHCCNPFLEWFCLDDQGIVLNVGSVWKSVALHGLHFRNSQRLHRWECWCFQCDPESKFQIMQLKTLVSPRPEKAQVSWAQMKTMQALFLMTFIINFEFREQDQTVLQHCYMGIFAAYVMLFQRRSEHGQMLMICS